MKSLTIAIIIGIAVLALAACSGKTSPSAVNSDGANASVASTARQTAPATITATASPTPTPPRTASEIVARLKAVGMPIDDSVTYTATTDTNHLLGRPGGYTSKVNFHDSRLPASPDFDTEAGGSVEVFPDAAGATSRMNYIQALAKGSPLFTEYDYVSGDAILRLSKVLTPDQASAYAAAFQALFAGRGA